MFSDVCAIRLDFETFTTQRDTVNPASEANACADIMTITVIFIYTLDTSSNHRISYKANTNLKVYTQLHTVPIK